MKLRGGMLLARTLRDGGVSRVFTPAGGFCNPALPDGSRRRGPAVDLPMEES